MLDTGKMIRRRFDMEIVGVKGVRWRQMACCGDPRWEQPNEKVEEKEVKDVEAEEEEAGQVKK